MKINCTNQNYCGTVIEVKNIIPLDNCDNVVHCNIFGNLVIVSKDVKVGDIGVYFPPETQLMPEYLSSNNLYRHPELNKDKDKKGYFGDNGRIRTVKFRGHKSMGLFMPLDSLSYLGEVSLEVGDEFNEIDDNEICKKYVVQKRVFGDSNKKKDRKPRESKIIDGQFRFHYETEQFGKNLHLFAPESIIHISKKVHGTSFVVGKNLCKKRINFVYKFMRFLGIPIIDKEYSMVYSSRKVIKNADLVEKKYQSYYKENIWETVANEIKDFMFNGMTVYGEIVGYLKNGRMIQKDYDYGCAEGTHRVYIYRITYTNDQGKVFEFSAKQVQDWCRMNGLNPVVELYYGRINNLFDLNSDSHWHENLLEKLKEKYLEKDCDLCVNKVPDEGIVIRDETTNSAFKLKSFRFYERETKILDSGKEDIESQESEETSE